MLEVYWIVMAEERKVMSPQEVDAEVKLIEAKTKTAKEQASRRIGNWGMPALIILVGMGIGSSLVLTVEALPAVIGLVSTVAMATITMLQGITGTKEEGEKAQADLMKDMIAQMNQSKGGTEVIVGEDGVSVQSGDTKIVNKN
jgi:hypothetical protein